jgi:hypothetical protein
MHESCTSYFAIACLKASRHQPDQPSTLPEWSFVLAGLAWGISTQLWVGLLTLAAVPLLWLGGRGLWRHFRNK